MNMNPQIFKQSALFSYFALMASLLSWILIAPHGETFPISAILIIAMVPLLFPLRGILHGKPYTFAWNSFLMLFYFAHGVGELYSASEFTIYPCLAIIFSFLCFTSSIIFVRLNSKMRVKSHN
jgi:uncharacterized membrane protein